jgi:hypothetical protein
MGCSQSIAWNEANEDPLAIHESQKQSRADLRDIVGNCSRDDMLYWSQVQKSLFEFIDACVADAKIRHQLELLVKKATVNRRTTIDAFANPISAYIEHMEPVIALAKKAIVKTKVREELTAQYRHLMLQKITCLNAAVHEVIEGDRKLCDFMVSFWEHPAFHDIALSSGIEVPSEQSTLSVDAWCLQWKKAGYAEAERRASLVSNISTTLLNYWKNRESVASSLQTWASRKNLPIVAEFAASSHKIVTSVSDNDYDCRFSTSVRQQCASLTSFVERVRASLGCRKQTLSLLLTFQHCAKKENKRVSELPNVKAHVEYLARWVSVCESLAEFGQPRDVNNVQARKVDFSSFDLVGQHLQRLLAEKSVIKPWVMTSTLFSDLHSRLCKIAELYTTWSNAMLKLDFHDRKAVDYAVSCKSFEDFRLQSRGTALAILDGASCWIALQKQLLENDTMFGQTDHSLSTSPTSAGQQLKRPTAETEDEQCKGKRMDSMSVADVAQGFSTYEALMDEWRKRKAELALLKESLSKSAASLTDAVHMRDQTEALLPVLCEQMRQSVLPELRVMLDAFVQMDACFTKIRHLYDHDRAVVLSMIQTPQDLYANFAAVKELENELDQKWQDIWTTVWAPMLPQTEILCKKFGAFYKDGWRAMQALHAKRDATAPFRCAVLASQQSHVMKASEFGPERDILVSQYATATQAAWSQLLSDAAGFWQRLNECVLAPMLRQNDVMLRNSTKDLACFTSVIRSARMGIVCNYDE